MVDKTFQLHNEGSGKMTPYIEG